MKTTTLKLLTALLLAPLGARDYEAGRDQRFPVLYWLHGNRLRTQ